METIDTTLGQWIAELYEAFLAELEDPELAALATASTVEERLAEQAHAPKVTFQAA